MGEGDEYNVGRSAEAAHCVHKKLLGVLEGVEGVALLLLRKVGSSADAAHCALGSAVLSLWMRVLAGAVGGGLQ